MKKNLLGLLILLLCTACGRNTVMRMMPLVKAQMLLEPRTPGSSSHKVFIDWATGQLKNSDWQITAETVRYRGRDVTNIIADRPGKSPDAEWILVGAHYDCRLNADRDRTPSKRYDPVPGANDGASGAAVLLALADALPREPDRRITLAFFDAEDQGDIPGWPDWCLGSQLLAEQYAAADDRPDEVIVLDMIGDADLNIFREGNSDIEITDRIWQIAAKKGYSGQFPNKVKYSMTDDHIPFLRIGIPSVDLIDFDYPYWHTTEDTADKLSEKSMKAVFDVIFAYLLR